MPEKGFTATFISNTGKTLHQFNISGWKLHVTRLLLALLVILFAGSIAVVAYGLINSGEMERLREEMTLLQDSLAVRRNIEARLEVMELQLQQLHGYRKKLENIAGLIPVPTDSLE